MKIRYATESDLKAWFNGTVPATMRAVVVEKDGRLIGIGGVSYMEDHLQAFSKITGELRPHKITIGRAAVMARKMLEQMGTVWAVCSPHEPTAPNLLEWAGFRHVQEGVWRRG